MAAAAKCTALDHSADLRVRCVAEDFPALATAFFLYLARFCWPETELQSQEAALTTWQDFSSQEGPPWCLVELLNEWIYQAMSLGLVGITYRGECERGEIGMVEVGYNPTREVKAATYQNPILKKTAGQLIAEITIDL